MTALAIPRLGTAYGDLIVIPPSKTTDGKGRMKFIPTWVEFNRAVEPIATLYLRDLRPAPTVAPRLIRPPFSEIKLVCQPDDKFSVREGKQIIIEKIRQKLIASIQRRERTLARAVSRIA